MRANRNSRPGEAALSDTTLSEVIGLGLKVFGKRFWIAAKDKVAPHKHYFRKGDVAANPESDYCRCYLCGEMVNIMEDSK